MPVIFRVLFFVGDMLFLNMAVILSYRFTSGLIESQLVNLVYLLIFSNLTWFYLIIVSNPYNFSRNWGAVKFFKNQISYLVVHLVVVAFLILFFRKKYEPEQIGLMYGIFVPVFFSWKLLASFVLTLFSSRRINSRSMIIVGEQSLIQNVRRYFLLHPELNYKFLTALPMAILNLQTIREFCEGKEVHEIFYCSKGISDEDFRSLIDFGLNRFIRIKIISSVSIEAGSDLSLNEDEYQRLSDHPVVPLDDPGNRVLKRFIDIVFSGLVIIFILSWLIPLIGILIKLNSRGPIYFVQKRAGLNNMAFDCLKFRTMIVNGESDFKQATKGDPRITSIGRFLRKSSLDEFPQFINVLFGDMSLIGPRPHPLKLNEDFEKHINDLQSRHYVKPGITGLAQSMGYRGETRNLIDMKNRIAMDRYYVENWSLWLDIKIIFRTIVSLVKGSENAY
ncbi:MAG TPA: exopolysaccharide biosynthesis polyprenyl glycosylphosphotransferase [Cyclobacteriaceae bacterium]|nr:exopolysaccharide biosynthesis polyprenyl glycosylphosphotransferase [Cyclobacteriaceae bacterium]